MLYNDSRGGVTWPRLTSTGSWNTAPNCTEKYAGKWIAVWKGEVIGVGDTAPQAAEQARQKAKDGEYILEALDVEADVIYGCA